MGRHACCAEDDAETVGPGILCKLRCLGRGAVGRQDVRLKGDVQRLELSAGTFHHRPVTVRTHNDCHFTNHLYPTSLSLSPATKNKKGCDALTPRPFISFWTDWTRSRLHGAPDAFPYRDGTWYPAAHFAFCSSSANLVVHAVLLRLKKSSCALPSAV